MSCINCITRNAIKKDINVNEARMIADRKIPVICVMGGEPTLHDSFVDILNLMSNNNSFVIVYTNGTNVEVFKDLDNVRMIRVVVSLHPNDNKDVLNKKVSFIKKIRSLGYDVYTNITVSSDIDMYNDVIVPDAYLSEVALHSRKIYVSKYHMVNCITTKRELTFCKDVARYINNVYDIKVVCQAEASLFQRVLLRMASFILYGEKVNWCSMYPFRRYVYNDILFGDCPLCKDGTK